MTVKDFNVNEVSEGDSDLEYLSDDNREEKKMENKSRKNTLGVDSRNNGHDDNFEELEEEEDIISVEENILEKDETSLDSHNLDIFENKPTRMPKKKKKKKPKAGTKTKGKKKKKKKGKRIADDEESNEVLLEEAVKRVSTPGVENPAELFLVSGDAGVGKSHWVESEMNRILIKIREDAHERSDDEEGEDSDDESGNFLPVFCRGTCEISPQLRNDGGDKTDNSFATDGCGMSRHPMHAITEALNDLICSLTKINYGNEERIDTELSTDVGNIYGGKGVWKQRIEDALGASEAAHLAATGIVPELGNLLNLSGSRAFIEKQKVSTTWDWNSPYKFHRSCVAIRDLLRAISEAHHPVVMVLHNLHLADKDTFRLLNFLLTGHHWNPLRTAEEGKRRVHKFREGDHLYGTEASTSTARLNNFLVIGLHELNTDCQNNTLHLLERSFSQRKKLYFGEESEFNKQSDQGGEIDSQDPTRIQSHLTKIHIEPFHRKKVEDLLRSSISQPKKSKIKDESERSSFDAKLRELAGLVFEWARGNVFYTLQVIELLKEDGAITSSSSSSKLDVAKAQALSHRWNNSTSGLTAFRIDRLPKAVRFIIINASIFRQTYIEFSLQELFHLLSAVYAEKGKKKKDAMDFPLESVSDLEEALTLACDFGFMKCVRCRRNGDDSSFRWAFAHTIIRDEAYSLFVKIKMQKKMEIHFRLGTKASALSIPPTSGEQDGGNLSNVNYDSFKFLASDQLALAEGILYQDCTKVAMLFVETAELCISKSAFGAAIQYLKVIIDILERNSLLFTAENHGLCVKIYLLLARLHFVCDHGTDDSSEALRQILENGKNLKDQIMLHQAEIGISVGQKSNEHALKQVLSALATFGEKFPPEVDLAPIIAREIDRLKELTEKKDNHSLLHPSHCTDKKTFDLMILLSNLIEISRCCRKEQYAEVAMIRMINICLIKGFTPQYSMSFAHYGAILIQRGLTTNNLNMAKEGYRMGQISEKMARVKSFSGGHSLAVFQYYISHWRRLYRRSLGQVLSIYNAQLESGDYYHIGFTTFTYVQYHLASGHNLTKLDDNLQLFDALYQDYKMDNHWIIELSQRFVQNMLGETLDPFLFYGNTIEEQNARIQIMQDSGEDDAVQLMHFFTLFVSIFFHNHELSKKCLENIVEEKVIPIWKPWIIFFRCYLDIISLQAIEKKSERKKAKDTINMQRDRLLDWYDQGAQNCSVMISLIDAELMISDYAGNYDSLPTIRIKKFFDDAIEVAEDQELRHMEAFCLERASIHFNSAGSDESSAEYIAKAHESYLEWNAIAKVDDIEDSHADKLNHARDGSVKMIGENYVKNNSDLQYNPERSIGGGRNIKKLDIKGAAKTAEKKVKEMAIAMSSGRSPKGPPKKSVVKSPGTLSRRPKLAISVRLGKTSAS